MDVEHARSSLLMAGIDEPGIAAAAAALAQGQLVLHRTETVISLSGDPYSEAAVRAARRLKGYREPRPFLCLVADTPAARALAADWPAAAARLAEVFWPGPLTLVLAAGRDAPRPVVADGRIAVRPASDPVSRRLLAVWAKPLFSTSANRRGDPPAMAVGEAVRRLAGEPDGVAVALSESGAGAGQPPARPGAPSTVVDVTVDPPRLVRAGAISLGRLSEVCPEIAS